MNINVKFKNQADYVSVHELAKYLNLTDKQFARIAILKQTQELVLDINKRIKAAQDAKAEELANVGKSSAPVDSAANPDALDSESPSPAA
jgi:hypothetical protein